MVRARAHEKERRHSRVGLRHSRRVVPLLPKEEHSVRPCGSEGDFDVPFGELRLV